MNNEIVYDFGVTTYTHAVVNDEELFGALEDCEPYVFKCFNDICELLYIEIDLAIMTDKDVLEKLHNELKQTCLIPKRIRDFISLVKYLSDKGYHTLQVYD